GHARCRQRVDHGDLVCRGHKHFFHLQAIARAHFLDVNAPPAAVPYMLCIHWMTPCVRNWAICSLLKPMSASTASVSSPSLGALERMVPGVADSLGTMPGTSTL